MLLKKNEVLNLGERSLGVYVRKSENRGKRFNGYCYKSAPGPAHNEILRQQSNSFKLHCVADSLPMRAVRSSLILQCTGLAQRQVLLPRQQG